MITPVVSELVTLAAMAALFWVVAEERIAGRSPIRSLGRRWFGRGTTTVGTIVVALVAGLMLVVLPLTPDLVRGEQREPGPAPFALVLLTVCVKLALVVSEEITFRGALLDWLRARLGTVQGVVASALCFGIAHVARPGDPSHATVVMSTVVDGLAFGAAAALTGSLWTPVAWHAAKNVAVWQLTSVSTLQFAPGLFAYGDASMPTTIEDVVWAAVMVVLALPLVWLLAGPPSAEPAVMTSE